ncbi:MAG: polysaccharide pyruvyl transferase family protein [Actinomycetota bacterium]
MSRPRIAVCGWIGSSNIGDELIAEQVAELLLDEGGDPTLVTIDTSRAPSDRATIRHAGALDTIGLLRELRHHDGLVFGGGGLLQDETGPLNIPFHLTRLAAGRLLRLPWACVGLGVGDVRRRSGQALTWLVVRGFVAASVRDADSVSRYRTLTGLEPELGIDPVLALPPRSVEPTSHLVVSLRPMNRPDQRRLSTQDGPAESQISRWAEAIGRVAAATGLTVRFISWDDAYDHAIHEAVADLLDVPYELEQPNAREVIDRIGTGRIVISMRYHGAVSAVVTGRPTLVLDYSPKMAALVDEVGPGLRVLHPEAPADDLVTAAHALLDDPAPTGVPDATERAAVNRAVVRRLLHAASER